MRVELSPEVFTATDSDARQIEAIGRLLAAFDERRHDWIVDIEFVDDIAAYLAKHHPSLAPGYLDLAQKAAVKNLAWTGATQRGRVVVVEHDSLVKHAADLTRAAVVVIENINGDKDFLRTVIHAFRAERVREAFAKDWAEFQHSGGCGSMPAAALEAAGHFHHIIRVVAVFDSDSLTPEHESPNRPKARELEAIGISTHVLMLREAENYAPHRVLADTGRPDTAETRVAHLKRLIPRQRRHFDMKNGLPPPHKVRREQRGFFDGLDAETRRVLASGFGDGVLKKMYEMRHNLTEDDFEATDPEAAEDLRKLLALIESLI